MNLFLVCLISPPLRVLYLISEKHEGRVLVAAVRCFSELKSVLAIFGMLVFELKGVVWGLVGEGCRSGRVVSVLQYCIVAEENRPACAAALRRQSRLHGGCCVERWAGVFAFGAV